MIMARENISLEWMLRTPKVPSLDQSCWRDVTMSEFEGIRGTFGARLSTFFLTSM